jgi:hypothetical protein
LATIEIRNTCQTPDEIRIGAAVEVDPPYLGIEGCQGTFQGATAETVTTEDGRDALDPTDLDQVAGCVGGAATPGELRAMLTDAGFEQVSIRPADGSDEVVRELYGDGDIEGALESAVIRGVKPAA